MFFLFLHENICWDGSVEYYNINFHWEIRKLSYFLFKEKSLLTKAMYIFYIHRKQNCDFLFLNYFPIINKDDYILNCFPIINKHDFVLNCFPIINKLGFVLFFFFFFLKYKQASHSYIRSQTSH